MPKPMPVGNQTAQNAADQSLILQDQAEMRPQLNAPETTPPPTTLPFKNEVPVRLP